MKKLYTHCYGELINEEEAEKEFSAEEHTCLTRKMFGDTIYKTKESFLREYLLDGIRKFLSVQFLIGMIEKNGYHNVLSLGAGQSVIEYLLQRCSSESTKIVACDFDSFIVDSVSSYFPELTVRRFDFFKDSVQSLQVELNTNFDLAVLFSSAYVMNDKEFVKHFSDLKKCGIRRIVDFSGGYMDWRACVLSSLSFITHNSTIRKILNKPLVNLDRKGKFHGYFRSRSELRALYRKSGLVIEKEMSNEYYKYIAILR